jgi:hypothetical protein
VRLDINFPLKLEPDEIWQTVKHFRRIVLTYDRNVNKLLEQLVSLNKPLNWEESTGYSRCRQSRLRQKKMPTSLKAGILYPQVPSLLDPYLSLPI